MRPKQVRLSAFNLSGEEVDVTATGLLARVVQHELDHLDGILFIDRMASLAQSTIRPTLDEFEAVFQSRRNVGEIPADDDLLAQRTEWEKRYC